MRWTNESTLEAKQLSNNMRPDLSITKTLGLKWARSLGYGEEAKPFTRKSDHYFLGLPRFHQGGTFLQEFFGRVVARRCPWDPYRWSNSLVLRPCVARYCHICDVFIRRDQDAGLDSGLAWVCHRATILDICKMIQPIFCNLRA